MGTVIVRLERDQVALYLAAIAVGGLAGLLWPELAQPATVVTTPALGVLLYVTFLTIPFGRMGAAIRDRRFLTMVLVLNFVIVPIVVFALSRFVAHDQVLLVGVLFVLLTPCVDYVITFTGLARGAQDRLLAATPLLMVGQMLALPAYLWVMVGAAFVASIDLAPFVQAFAMLIAVPLVAAAFTQFAAARSRAVARFHHGATQAMVPLLMLTLAAVVASNIGSVSQRIGHVLGLVPLYVAFAGLMAGLSVLGARVARLDVAGSRATVFAAVTRNSLVVLPLVLALPRAYDLAPVVVVTQTLVELILMVILVRLVPRMLPAARGE